MKYLLLLLLFPSGVAAQDVSGVWTGYMYNDTTHQQLQFELAINRDKKKLSGFSHITFTGDDHVRNIGVKSVDIREKEGHYYVVDDKFIYNNYSEPPAKGVKVFCFLSYSETDTSEVLSGIWRTNATKVYLPLTGTVFLERKKKTKPEETVIVKELARLGYADKLTFLPPSFDSRGLVAMNKPAPAAPVTPKPKAAPDPPSPNLSPAVKEPVAAKTPPAAADIASRKIETIRTVAIEQDSLVFSLYDNGTVDGDTVSVIMNGKVIMPRVGLLEKAYNKTVYLTPDLGDSVSVVMYAENLGSIPPNTGLLVIRDGPKNYEIRFSGDLKKNSEIILIRKKKP